jgi:hypothetical protein
MKTTTRNAALNVNLTFTVDPILDLDEQLRRAFQGDRDALDAVARELRPELAYEACEYVGDLRGR